MKKQNILLFTAIALILLFCTALLAAKNRPLKVSKEKIEKVMNAKMKKVEEMLTRSRAEVLAILKKQGSLKPLYDDKHYSGQKGVYLTDHNHTNDTNYFVPGRYPITGAFKKYLQVSEHFEKIFKKNKKLEPDLGWQYVLNYEHAAMRVYPWANPNVVSKQDIEWENLGFYQITKENKDKNTVKCTDAGADAVGLGTITSCTLPIVFEGKDYGIIGLDVVFKSFFSEVRKLLGNTLDHFAFIVQSKENEVIKPAFVDYIFKNPVSLRDFNFDKVNKIWEFNNIRFKAEYKKISIKFHDFELLVMNRS